MTVSAIESHLGYWLRYVSNHVSHAFARKLTARGVTVAEWIVLRDLFDHDAVMPSALADRIGLTRGAVSKLADRLIAKTLIARRADATDRRSHALSLTPAGRALVPRLSALADRNDAEFFSHLPPRQRALIERAMKDIVRRHKLRAVPVD
jgi:DNA-binding MarR family transcriptional regulator